MVEFEIKGNSLEWLPVNEWESLAENYDEGEDSAGTQLIRPGRVDSSKRIPLFTTASYWKKRHRYQFRNFMELATQTAITPIEEISEREKEMKPIDKERETTESTETTKTQAKLETTEATTQIRGSSTENSKTETSTDTASTSAKSPSLFEKVEIHFYANQTAGPYVVPQKNFKSPQEEEEEDRMSEIGLNEQPEPVIKIINITVPSPAPPVQITTPTKPDQKPNGKRRKSTVSPSKFYSPQKVLVRISPSLSELPLIIVKDPRIPGVSLSVVEDDIGRSVRTTRKDRRAKMSTTGSGHVYTLSTSPSLRNIKQVLGNLPQISMNNYRPYFHEYVARAREVPFFPRVKRHSNLNPWNLMRKSLNED